MTQLQGDSRGPEQSGLNGAGAPVVYGNVYVSYVVGILMVVYIFNFMDRQILSILMQPIKMEMQLTDTELGFLGGVAFAIFYSILGLPIARMADKYSRVNILAICLGLWSVMTALCAAVLQFVLHRVSLSFLGSVTNPVRGYGKGHRIVCRAGS